MRSTAELLFLQKVRDRIETGTCDHLSPDLETELEDVLRARIAAATMPPLTKSTSKAMRCQAYYAAQYLSPVAVRTSTEMAQIGTDFHAYKQAYIDHLVATRRDQDQPWAWEWLARQMFSEEARELITQDIQKFRISPANVFGTEVLLSIDEHFEPLACKPGVQPGDYSGDRESYARTTIDLLMLTSREAHVWDWKSGWAKPDEYEAAFIAFIVLCHFGWVEKVVFTWQMVRLGESVEMTFARDDFDWIAASIRRGRMLQIELSERYAAGNPMHADPGAGLCGFCRAECPMRPAITAGEIAIPPVADKETAGMVAARLLAAEATVDGLRAALTDWLEKNGPIQIGKSLWAENSISVSKSYPADKALAVLGVAAPAVGNFDVPLAALTIGGLSEKAKTKKRAALKEQLDAIAKNSLKQTVRFRREDPKGPSLEHQLTESLAAARAKKERNGTVAIAG